MIERNDADALCAPDKLAQCARERIRIEPLDRVDPHVEFGSGSRLLLDMRMQSGDEGVVSLRQNEIQPYGVAGIDSREGGRRLSVGQIAEPHSRLEHNIACPA